MSEVKTETANLPEVAGDELPAHEIIHMPSLPVSLQIFFNDQLFKRCQTVANYLAKAEGYAPRHLIGKPEACFAVVSRSLTWRLDPYAVAQATYQTPGGAIGYYGSLCQAIIENSGRLDPSYGGVKFEHVGDWSVLRGKFKLASGRSGGEYPVPAWEPYSAIEAGLGVIVRAKLRDEDLPREMPFDLVQAYPRNSTLWATDPRTQIQYTAVRRFSTSTVPTLFMGVPFDHEDMDQFIQGLRDVTPPRPELADYSPQAEEGGTAAAPTSRRRAPRKAAAEEPTTGNGAAGPAQTATTKKWFFHDEVGQVYEFDALDEAVTAYTQRLGAATRAGNRKALEATWDNGAQLLAALRERGHTDIADALNNAYGQLLDEVEAVAADAGAGAGAAKEQPAQHSPWKGGGSGSPAPTSSTSSPSSNEAPPAPDAIPADTPVYDVRVPLAYGQSINQWHMAARDRLKAMTEAQRPSVDFLRFREVNKVALQRLHDELRSWANMLNKEIDRGLQGAP